jgi:trk system potassium uptake protein TrkH
MTSSTIIALLIGKKIGIGERLIMKVERQVLAVEGIVKFTKRILLFTFLTEAVGTCILTARFLADYNVSDAFLYGFFHAVSAFNNAGFSLFSDNLMRFRGDMIINLTIPSLIIIGGIGFVVMNELYVYYKKEINRLSQHTKLVLLTTTILIIGGMILIFLFELTNPKTFETMSLKEKLFISFFSAVTPRTAGFNTVDYSLLRTETLLATIILMFIGASPGSTGGGVKTSTFAVVVTTLFATIRGREDVVLFKRRLPLDTILKSFLVVTLAAIFCTLSTHLVITTQGTQYLPTLFEVTSAFGTVGLSVGDGGIRSLSALFSPLGKLAIIFAMFVGRLGPLTLAFAVTRQAAERFRYPEGRVIIG